MCSNLGETLYREREETGDICFIVGSERIQAHRCVLAASSPVYKEKFFGPDFLTSAREPIHVRDVSASAFNEFIKFFYLRDVGFSDENIKFVLELATETDFDECIDQCESFLSIALDDKNVCSIYQLAIEQNLLDLECSCVSVISRFTAEVLASDAFLTCDDQILLKILNLNCLRCEEIDVMNSCVSWAKAKCKREYRMDDSPKNLRTILKDAVRLIRFASMSIEEFYDLNVQYKGFFGPEECVEITGIICGHRSYGNFTLNRRQQFPGWDTSSEEDW